MVAKNSIFKCSYLRKSWAKFLQTFTVLAEYDYYMLTKWGVNQSLGTPFFSLWKWPKLLYICVYIVSWLSLSFSRFEEILLFFFLFFGLPCALARPLTTDMWNYPALFYTFRSLLNLGLLYVTFITAHRKSHFLEHFEAFHKRVFWYSMCKLEILVSYDMNINQLHRVIMKPSMRWA